ncbi:hypothetical protein HD596_008481 [Nonomuraea jabiensis]|uniref:Aminoglycoside phosphotransferase domain-containing protein n=1 Tax=Nonomuraea jabiensis TaxID=882448 RepID=A0A7W9GDD6_9ACTN|nr:hypothetical protein [Nonomuraea jabiensis]MBB5781725.1 hypothetical protein [Nonomuraea jabiensis]
MFYGRQARYCTVAPEAGHLPVLGHRWSETSHRLKELGMAPNGRAAAELAMLHEVLAEDDPEHRKLLVLTNGDPEPNNFLVERDHGWLINFEFAGYRHALTDLTWARPAPCWCGFMAPAGSAAPAPGPGYHGRNLAAAEDIVVVTPNYQPGGLRRSCRWPATAAGHRLAGVCGFQEPADALVEGRADGLEFGAVGGQAEAAAQGEHQSSIGQLVEGGQGVRECDRTAQDGQKGGATDRGSGSFEPQPRSARSAVRGRAWRAMNHPSAPSRTWRSPPVSQSRAPRRWGCR